MSESISFKGNFRIFTIILMGIGLLAITSGFCLYEADHHQRFWYNILINNYYFVGLALGALFFISIQYVSNAGWAVGLKRVPEAMGAFIPVAALLMLIFWFGGLITGEGHHTIYHWTQETLDPILKGKSPYLNNTFFLIRIVLFFGLWTFFWWFFRKSSLKEDADGDIKHYKSRRKTAVFFLIVFAITVSFASFDWIMSVDPHWFSTMFGVYNFAGLFTNGLAVLAILTFILHKQGYLKHINQNHFHNLAMFIFAFSTFWVYVWFFQLQLIWYANMPEEVGYFIPRIGGYEITASGKVIEFSTNTLWLFILNPLINWAVPFFVLMTRNSKRNMKVVVGVSVVLLAGHWLDIFLMVVPSLTKNFQVGLFELGTFLGYAGLFMFVVGSAMNRAPLLPKNHPLVEESLHHHI